VDVQEVNVNLQGTREHQLQQPREVCSSGKMAKTNQCRCLTFSSLCACKTTCAVVLLQISLEANEPCSYIKLHVFTLNGHIVAVAVIITKFFTRQLLTSMAISRAGEAVS
jgi:hypothetical protein